MKYTVPPIVLTILSIAVFCIGCGGTTSGSLGSNGHSETNVTTVSDKDAREIFLTYEAAKDISLKEQKPVLLFFTEPNCPYSSKLMNKTIKEKDVSKLIEQFVCVQINVNERKDICEEFAIDGWPTVQFLSANGVPLQRLDGKDVLASDTLSIQMHAALQSMPSPLATKKTDSEPR